MISIYIAAPLGEAGRACEVARKMSGANFRVNSMWHWNVMDAQRETGCAIEDSEGAARREDLEKNLADLRDADVVLVLLDRGRGRCTLVEIGYALALGKRVVWLGERNLADAHPNVTYVETEGAAIEACLKTGVKRDDEKPRFDLIPPLAEFEVAKVVTFGSSKYGPDNWRRVDNARARYLAAAMRHINALRSGNFLDGESGLHHAAHAICCLLFLLELDLETNEV